MNVKTVDRNGTLLQHELDKEFSTLKINWFPGHMVKATKVIREKLKQVGAQSGQSLNLLMLISACFAVSIVLLSWLTLVPRALLIIL